MAKIKKIKIFLAIFLLACLGFLVYFLFFSLIEINSHFFLARSVLSEFSRERGLSGRKDLCKKCAMIFNFKKKGKYSFWMKDMNFDLDIIWIADEKVVYIKKNFSHESSEIVQPGILVDKVVEINAGLADRYGFKIGDEVKIY